MVRGRNSSLMMKWLFRLLLEESPILSFSPLCTVTRFLLGTIRPETVTTTYKFRLQIYGSSVLWSVAFGPPDHLCRTFLLAVCLLQVIASFINPVHYNSRDIYRPGLPSFELGQYCVLECLFLFPSIHIWRHSSTDVSIHPYFRLFFSLFCFVLINYWDIISCTGVRLFLSLASSASSL